MSVFWVNRQSRAEKRPVWHGKSKTTSTANLITGQMNENEALMYSTRGKEFALLSGGRRSFSENMPNRANDAMKQDRELHHWNNIKKEREDVRKKTKWLKLTWGKLPHSVVGSWGWWHCATCADTHWWPSPCSQSVPVATNRKEDSQYKIDKVQFDEAQSSPRLTYLLQRLA